MSAAASNSDYDAVAYVVDGREIYYRDGDVVAVGQEARDRVAEIIADESPPGPIDLPGRGDRPVYLFRGVDNCVSVVQEARAAGVRVQLNHVLLSDACRHCDPCCPEEPSSPQLDAADVEGQPVKANPVKANTIGASKSTAKPATEPAHWQPTPLGGGAAQVWILDTGRPADGIESPLPNEDPNGGHRTDRLDEDGNQLLDVVAGHGTFIAGIIGQLDPRCTIRVRDVMDEHGRVLECDVPNPDKIGLWDVMDEVLSAADERTILNLSFGGDLDEPFTTVLAELVLEAQARCAVVVASAGNDASCQPSYPAAFPGVVSVGAVDADGQTAAFTNRGSWVRTNALGVDITSTFLQATGNEQEQANEERPFLKDFTSGWATWSGTSFAAPVVTAAIAREVNDGCTATEALARILYPESPRTIPCLGVHVAPDGVRDLVHTQPSSNGS